MAEIKGLDNLRKQLRNLENINPSKALLAGAYTLQNFSMKNAPVKTGFLRQSHESVGLDDSAEMRVHANYAIYVEFGTYKMPAKPFVRPAIDDNSDEIVRAIAEQLQKDIEESL